MFFNLKEGEGITLPETSKEGFIFDGWYIGDEKVEEGTVFEEDAELLAKWISEDAKEYTITFDSNGGSEVDSITLREGASLTLPDNPTRSGYSFVSWKDSGDVAITNGVILSAEDITLTAEWKKVETSGKAQETTKKYTCPDGYTLDGTKCTKVVTEDAILKTSICPKETIASGDICIVTSTITTGRTSCTQYGDDYVYSSSEQKCYYDLWASGTDRETCGMQEGKFYNGNCYRNVGDPIYTCPKKYVAYKQSNGETACAQTAEKLKTYGCKEKGYVLDGTKCSLTTTIDATLE